MKRSRKYFSVIIAIILALSCIVLPGSAAGEPAQSGIHLLFIGREFITSNGDAIIISSFTDDCVFIYPNADESELYGVEYLCSDGESIIITSISEDCVIIRPDAVASEAACPPHPIDVTYSLYYYKYNSTTHTYWWDMKGKCQNSGCTYTVQDSFPLSESAHSGGVPSSSSVPYPADATYCAGSVTTTKYSACGQCGFQKPTETKYPPTHTLTTSIVNYSATVTDCPYTVTTKSHSCGYSSSTVSPANHTHSFTTYPGYKKCNKCGEIVPTVAGMSILDELGIDYTDLTPEEIVEILHDAGYTYFTEDNLLIE